MQTRHLNQNAVRAFALDRGLDQAELIDAALDDLDRLIDGLANALDKRRVRRRERDEPAALGYVDAALPRGAEYAGQGLRQFAQLANRVVDVALASDACLHAVAADGAPGERNAILAQDAEHVVGDALESFLAHSGSVDLEQQARATLEIKAKHDVTLRPRRPFPHRRLGEEIRHGEQTHDERHEQNTRRLPPREKQHRCDCPRCDRALVSRFRSSQAPLIRASESKPISCCCRPSPARLWPAPPTPSSAFGERERRPRFRPRSGRRRRPS